MRGEKCIWLPPSENEYLHLFWTTVSEEGSQIFCCVIALILRHGKVQLKAPHY